MDSRRRGAQKRPAQSEGHEVWAKLTGSIGSINDSLISSTTSEHILRANRLMNELEIAMAENNVDAFDAKQDKLRAVLEEIKRAAKRDHTLMGESLETLSVLKGMRIADEAARVQAVNEKRNIKRQKMSPAAGPSGPPRIPMSPPLAQTAMRTASKQVAPLGRPPKTKMPGLPLRDGRDVAFKQSKGETDGEWILAKVVKVLDGANYIVQDVDPGPDSTDKFPAMLKDIIPLPDSDAPNPYQGFPNYSKGTRVIAQYPDTTSFYPAQIISGRHPPAPGTKLETYSLEFDDDEHMERKVPAHRVVVPPML